jgi:DNA-binding response OmpR family regulator
MNALEKLGMEVAAFQLLGSRAKASTLCALIDAGGRALDCHQIADARPWMQREATDPLNVVKTRISLLRESLDDVGLEGVIETHVGRRYALPEPGRSRVVERLIEVAA